MARSKYNWSSVDWNQPTDDIMTETGAGRSQVSRARKKFAPETIGKFLERRKSSPSADWSKVDWSKGSADLARGLGVDRMTVYYNRRKYAPETIRKSGRPRKSDNDCQKKLTKNSK